MARGNSFVGDIPTLPDPPPHSRAPERAVVGGQMVDKRTDSMPADAWKGVARVRRNRHIAGTIAPHACCAANRL